VPYTRLLTYWEGPMGKVSRPLIVACGLMIALAATSSVPTAQTQRIPQLENAHVKVWTSTILPNQPLPPRARSS